VDRSTSAKWPAERTVPAAAVRAVLTNPDVRIDPAGLWLRGARFREPLNLAYVDFAHPLSLTECVVEFGLFAPNLQVPELWLLNTTVNGEVCAVGARIGGRLVLIGATLNNPNGDALSLHSAQIGGDVLADELRTAGAVHAPGASVVGQLRLSGATLSNPDGIALSLENAQISGGVSAAGLHAAGALMAPGARIGGQLSLSRATLNNSNGDALDLDSAQITRDVFAAGLQADGAVHAVGASIGGLLDLSGARLNNPTGTALGLDGAKIARDVFARDFQVNGVVRVFHAYGLVRALGATIGGQLDLTGAALNNPSGYALNLDQAHITGSVHAGCGFRADGEVRALNMTVGGQLDLRRATLNTPNGRALSLHGAQITRDVFAGKLHADGAVSGLGATIGGQLDLREAMLNNPDGDALDLDRAQITGDMFASYKFCARGVVCARGATIGGQLLLTGATLTNHHPDGEALAMESATVGHLLLEPEKWNGSLNLGRAKIGHLTTAEQPPGPLTATGWTVGDLHGPLRDNWRKARLWLDTARPARDSSTRSQWRTRTAWLRNNKPPVPVQSWHALADVYDRNGDPASARRLRFAAANIVTAQSPPKARIVRVAYCVVVGNGYYPLLAVFSVILLLAIGASMVTTNREDIVPTNPTAAEAATERHLGQQAAPRWVPITARTPCEVHPDYPCMHAMTFTVNSLLPSAGSTNRDWMVAPNASFLLVAGLPAIKIALWALAGLVGAGVTGLLRKN
jgi:hypothetical protein